ncbi:methylmalonyl-CoA mutase family protein [Danxiaibacter flavus]|uniref:Methylmalonyl-CoA mutase family protein n=1 Tax=Danxiaibacter flavus TaxID=3049108 RepID=A0ABV3ZGP3_9BACT|nr:methylmalonyl-CoA mutase family protein [Chitinophagaceae bacterium DXS]
MNLHKLFSDFPKIPKEEWKAKATGDLKGSDFNKKLVWKTDEGFDVQPFYTPEDLDETKILSRQDFCKASAGAWTRYVEVNVTDMIKANEEAHEMLEFGANGFLFRLKDTEHIEFDLLLNNLDLAENEVSFSLPVPSVTFTKAYFDYVRKKGVAASALKGFIESDILGWASLDNTRAEICELAEVVRLSLKYPGFKTVVIKSHAFANAGCNSTQEIAFTLNKLIDYIDLLLDKWLVPKELLDKILFHMAIGGDYFFEIAKLRALKLLLARIAPLYAGNTSCMRIMSSNSMWSKSALDPNVNLLRNTSEAMSAVLGGCDALLVQPHDKHCRTGNKFSQRIALNISNLLKEESYFDKVTDPTSGSYYIENLTTQLAESALDLLQKIEDKGGFIACYNSGIIQEKICEIRNQKQKDISSRKRVYVGSNKFPDPAETAPLNLRGRHSSKPGKLTLPQQHAAYQFEELKNRTLMHWQKAGSIPAVYMACFGDLAMRKTRSTFAGEFFGVAGFKVLDEVFFDSIDKAVEESTKSEADIVVMCSSDEAYVAEGTRFAKKFRSASKHKLLVVAGYPETVVEQLKNAGVDEFIHLRSNAIEVLGAFQCRLGIT